jgi:hypothetical protein
VLLGSRCVVAVTIDDHDDACTMGLAGLSG